MTVHGVLVELDVIPTVERRRQACPGIGPAVHVDTRVAIRGIDGLGRRDIEAVTDELVPAQLVGPVRHQTERPVLRHVQIILVIDILGNEASRAGEDEGRCIGGDEDRRGEGRVTGGTRRDQEGAARRDRVDVVVGVVIGRVERRVGGEEDTRTVRCGPDEVGEHAVRARGGEPERSLEPLIDVKVAVLVVRRQSFVRLEVDARTPAAGVGLHRTKTGVAQVRVVVAAARADAEERGGRPVAQVQVGSGVGVGGDERVAGAEDDLPGVARPPLGVRRRHHVAVSRACRDQGRRRPFSSVDILGAVGVARNERAGRPEEHPRPVR